LGGLELKFRSFRGRFYDLFRRVCPFFRFINVKCLCLWRLCIAKKDMTKRFGRLVAACSRLRNAVIMHRDYKDCIGQMSDSPLAILTSSQHKGNYSTLHANTGGSASNIDRTLFEKQKKDFWKALLDMAQGGA